MIPSKITQLSNTKWKSSDDTMQSTNTRRAHQSIYTSQVHMYTDKTTQTYNDINIQATHTDHTIRDSQLTN